MIKSVQDRPLSIIPGGNGREEDGKTIFSPQKEEEKGEKESLETKLRTAGEVYK